MSKLGALLLSLVSQHQSLLSCRETLNALLSNLSPLQILSNVHITGTFASFFTLRYISVKVFFMCFAVTEKMNRGNM